MASDPKSGFVKILQQFATDVTEKFSLLISVNPEDQLKAPIETLLKGSGSLLNLDVVVVTEVQEKVLSGRPDVGVAVSTSQTPLLLAGQALIIVSATGAFKRHLRDRA